MSNGLTKLFESIIGPLKAPPDAIDELQLEAAKDRLHQRSEDLNESVDELSKMIKRMKRTQGQGRRKS